jgi:signal transduction histidine kinase
MVDEDDIIADMLAYLIILYTLIVASVVIVNHVILRRLWRPFYNILSQLKAFDLRDPAPLRHDDSRITEFSEMAHAVSGVLKNNIDRYNSQRHFIENASHELQTPLAIAINKLELMLEDSELSQKHGEELARLLETLHRLTRLNKALILITNIENKHFIEAEELGLGEIIKNIIDDLSLYAEHKKVQVTLTTKSEFSLGINRDLATIMITNLIRNALLHNYEGGTVTVTVSEHSFSVANTSANDKLDSNKLYMRFYRQKQKAHSLGLGLSIVKEICKLNGLQVNYRFYSPIHEFTVARLNEA